ncbi:T9SS type A sorting domain-containing protein [Formosa sediminum]|uniref:T9SS type A sorting domain-containing protein n=1 Tax=Formosa sediminum TaxID=2594004 RepID=A0A516GRI9_9FLAO|nr:endonuclease [Formosa sediminum]QDO93980.1 T9SS type A sorting domain-containing protein [Formosa sediminum]
MKHFYISFLLLFTTLLGYAQLTPPDDLQAYYNTVNFTKTGLELKADLSAVTTAKHVKYLSYTPEVWEALKVTDLDPTNSDNVLLVYGYDDTDGSTSTDRSRSKNNNGGSTGQWNREHIYPKSLGTPNLGESGPGSDALMLRPSDIARNSDRGNLKFADGTGTSFQTTDGWYPGDEWKGDCARIIMYMYIRYGEQCLPSNVGFGSSANTPDEMIDLFLEWNVEDPVSDFEKQRNAYHGDTSNTYAQGNRNPFIDNPYLATAIWGGDAAQNLWDGNTAEEDTEAPTMPTDLAYSDVTETSATLTWTAATDNVAVASYNIFMDGTFLTKAYTNSITISDLTAETTYAFSVSTEDAAGNTSATTAAITLTTSEAIVYEYCTSESFENITGNINTYYDEVSWTGDNGLEWTATDARIDQTIDNSKAICVRDGVLSATETSGGIRALTVTTLRVFSGGSGTFDLVVNGTVVGQIPYSEYEETTTIENINIAGDVTIVFNNKATSSDRVVIDNLAWTCYENTNSDYCTEESFTNLTSTQDINDSQYADRTWTGDNGLEWSATGARIDLSNNSSKVITIRNGVLTAPETSGGIGSLTVTTLRTFSGGSGTFDLVVNGSVVGQIPYGEEELTTTLEDINVSGTVAVVLNNISSTSDRVMIDDLKWTCYDAALSIEEDTLSNIKVYPNPMNSTLNIALPNGNATQISIYNMLGKRVISKTIQANTSIDTKNLQSGVYILRMTQDNATITKKLIKN